MQEKRSSADNVMRSAYIWNSIGSLINAFQSVIILVFLTRVCSLEDAGIFTLAFANANLFLNMGKYGMRNYQASDVAQRYGFKAYRASRAVTCALMIACGSVHLVFSAISNSYSLYKSLCILAMIALKVIDAVEDVYDGAFQQVGRLDISGKQMTLRMCCMIASFVAAAIVTKNLVVSTLAAFVVSLTVLVGSLVFIKAKHGLPGRDAATSIATPWGLLRDCLPLFISTFLLFYIGNAPKYAIDTYLSDVAQAQYGFIAMPVFVVSLLAQFVYMPLVEPLSSMWANHEIDGFIKTFTKQVGIVGLITLVCVAGSWLLGVPVLSAFYNTDLAPFKLDLCILVFGGGFLAFATLFTMGLTVMRQQDKLTPGYVVVAIVALIISNRLVQSMGIRGASYAYIVCMVTLALWYCLMFYRYCLAARKDRN